MPQRLSLEQVLDRFRPGSTVYVPGMSGESLALYEALRARPEAARGVRFVGAHFPGINRSDYLGLHPETRQLFAYVEIEDEARWAAIAKTEVCQRWWKHMGDLMPSNPDHSPVARELKEVFHLG